MRHPSDDCDLVSHKDVGCGCLLVFVFGGVFFWFVMLLLEWLGVTVTFGHGN